VPTTRHVCMSPQAARHSPEAGHRPAGVEGDALAVVVTNVVGQPLHAVFPAGWKIDGLASQSKNSLSTNATCQHEKNGEFRRGIWPGECPEVIIGRTLSLIMENSGTSKMCGTFAMRSPFWCVSMP